jgi:uncharacterized protein (DUF885 family)
MKKIQRAFLTFALIGLLWGFEARAADDARFEQVVNAFVFGTLALSPSGATGVGYHRHHGVSLDDLLDDFSPAGIAASRSFLNDIERQTSKFDAASLNPEQHADMDIMRDAIGAQRLELDDIQSYRHNPTMYVELVGNALYTPYVLKYAPVPERFKHIIRRLAKVPELIRQAEANLQDSPEEWNRVAREENDGNIELIGTMRGECPPALRMSYEKSAAAALDSLRSFNTWLNETLAKKTADWRLGKELYAKKFHFVLATGKTPDELLREAEADLVKMRHQMVQLSAPKSVEEALADVARQHASPDTYMASAKQTLAGATAFVKAKDLVTLPARSNLQVIETPVFMRGIYGVGGSTRRRRWNRSWALFTG